VRCCQPRIRSDDIWKKEEWRAKNPNTGPPRDSPVPGPYPLQGGGEYAFPFGRVLFVREIVDVVAGIDSIHVWTIG
jgi:hypothetical protein